MDANSLKDSLAMPVSSFTFTPAPTSLATSYLDSPSIIIEKLDASLGKSGCIKNPNEVPKVVNFMKESDMMVNRCIVLNVIKATDAQTTLSKFMDVGGWGVLNIWLAEAKKSQNTSMLVEILQVLQKLPVSIESLKQGNMGKLIKQLSKQENGDVQSLAGDLLDKWMAVFRKGQSAKSKSTEDKRNNSTADNDSKNILTKKEKKSSGKKKEGGKGGKGGTGPPPESVLPPPGPLVPLGKPRDKTVKRPRDLVVGGQPSAEKKSKPSPSQVDGKSGKGLMESEGFMNALSTQAAKMKEKKIKKASKIAKLSRNNSTGDSAPDPKQDLPTTEGNEAESTEDMEVIQNGDTLKKKKKVTWATDDKLAKVHYFEMDESERVNVNRPTSFLDAAQQEKLREREALASGLMFSRDRLIEMIPWQSPHQIEVSGELVERGLESKEKDIQAEREGKVLAQLFLSKSSVQPSPMEPDPEPDIVETEPKLIPLMEPNAGGVQHQPPVFASPPHLPLGTSAVVPPDSPLPSPATTINQAQSFINYFNEHRTNPMAPPGQVNHGGGGGPNEAPGNYQGTDNNGYFPQPHGYPSHSQGNGPLPVSGQWGGGGGGVEEGGYYGDRYFRGQGDHLMRRGRSFGPPRGRGRGFLPTWRRGLESKICKHFITHGCKLGTRCRFLHCTPEELANKMAKGVSQETDSS